ncbi:unnamed protein product [Didymodactylos carnosus]|uniref:DNA replication and repair protein RecF n=3 Tax=Didymodactylos carnosus TaxID=1234261 RepID=A0A814QQW9_9BILA|nr:unnamed protein product [Didymodactylos carnosus]CAF3886563.1 unnamed protein product [Didymodactylos carnosus]
MLPDIDGLEVLLRLRSAKVKTPILILSGLTTVDQKIKGLTSGADDYLTKPFNRSELVARIHAISRRSKGHSESVIKFDKVTMHLDTRTVEVSGTKVHLTNKEYAILELLVMRRGTVLSKEMFLNHLYSSIEEPEIKIIDVFICKLRKKLADAAGGTNYIDTVWGRGQIILTGKVYIKYINEITTLKTGDIQLLLNDDAISVIKGDYDNLKVSVSNNSVILIGGNGSGKTNILESISLFSPGKGLRSAKLENICKQLADHCEVYTLLQSKMGPANIVTSFKRESSRRVTEFNGSKIQNNELSKFTSMLWLTPQMDGIFAASTTDRRKFFDRIVYNFIPTHAYAVSKYEYYMDIRSKTLSQEQIDDNWLSVIEGKMAELSVEITINRLKTLQDIQKTIDDFDNNFPKATLSLNGIIEEKILNDNKIELDYIKQNFLVLRNRDKISNRTNFGVHKSDFLVSHREKNTLAKLCSTGEQKAMLIALILAQVNYCIKADIAMPILLLDEVFVHLDEARRGYLIELFLELKLQLWVTATDLNGIEALVKKAELIKLPD